MSNSYAHDHYPLPLAVIGGRLGRHPDRTPIATVWRDILDGAGIPLT
jgi:hypothetical protein